MGARTSRQQQQHDRTNTGAYAAWNHRIDHSRNNIPSFTTQQKKLAAKFNDSKSYSASQLPAQHEKAFTPSLHNRSARKIPLYDPNTPKQTLGLRRSQSTGNLSSAAVTVVTTQQLLDSQAKRKQRNKSSSSSQISIESLHNHTNDKSALITSINQVSSTKPKRKTIPHDLRLVFINSNDLQNIREIGRGNFGTVYHALYKGTRDVALKTLNVQNGNSPKTSVDNDDENMYELLHEAHIMTRLKHANVLRIIGVTFFGDQQQLSLVTGFMKDGSLLDYLHKYRTIFVKSNPKDVTQRLNHFARQIFAAMAYLEEQNVIHRDLAARNCLIGEDDTLKVGDFGLTKLAECGLYKATYRSVCAPRWASPEALFSSKYSSRSDVWSYGITLWEVYSLGEQPFGNMNNYGLKVILRNSSEILSHYLPKPRFGSDETYTHIILRCLTYNVTMRPRFRDLTERISTILENRI